LFLLDLTWNPWNAIDERRLLNAKKEQAFSTRKETAEITEANRLKDKEVKSRCRTDKKLWIESKISQAEEAAGRNDSKTLYWTMKDLSGRAMQRVPINGTDGKTLKSQEEEANRWTLYFQVFLDCRESTEIHDVSSDCIDTLDVDTDEKTTEEVEKAIKKLKNGTAAGIDDIQAKLLKHGGEELVRRLTKLCNRTRETGETPRDWCDGIIIPLPKKGDLRDCNNGRDITLLSAPRKVLSCTILDRLKNAYD
jgi:hypothetical protein